MQVGAQVDAAPGRCVLGRIGQHVGHHLHQARLVTEHRDAGRRQAHGERLRARVDRRAHLLDRFFDDGARRHARLAQRDQATRHARDVEQIVHQPRHVAHLAADDGAALVHPARIDVAEPEQLGRGADRRERIAQLVREHRQEFILAAVGLHQLFFNQLAVGDVAEERRDAAVLGRIGA